MSTIKINVTGLETNKNNLKGYITDLEQCNSDLDTLLNTIKDTWQGNASTEFVKKTKQQEKDLKSMKKVVEDVNELITTISTNFKNVDNFSAKKINNSF